MTNAKIKVSKEVAEAIEELYVEYGGKTPDRIEVITYDIIRVVEMRKVFGGMRLQDVIKAISDGYEIEKQPEETIQDEWKRLSGLWRMARRENDSENFRVASAKQSGIKFALEAYGLKIEGVNA